MTDLTASAWAELLTLVAVNSDADGFLALAADGLSIAFPDADAHAVSADSADGLRDAVRAEIDGSGTVVVEYPTQDGDTLSTRCAVVTGSPAPAPAPTPMVPPEPEPPTPSE